MKRYVAVQVQYPRLAYVDLFPLDGRHRSQRRLAPIEESQRAAVVRLFLMHSQDRAGGPATPERELHTFRMGPLPTRAGTVPVLTLDADFDGARTVHFRIAGGGIAPQTADVRVPRGRLRWRWLVLLLLLLLLGVGAFTVMWTPSGPVSAVPRDEPEPEPEPTVSTEAIAGAEDFADAGADAASLDVDLPDDGPADDGPADDGPADAGPADSGRAADQEREAVLPETELQVYFEPNRTRLRDASRDELDKLAPVLQDHPDAQVSIIGHTALYGTEEGRTEISRGRAQEVASYLRGQGWEPRNEPSLRWVGSRSPVTRDPDDQQRNRRVEVFVGGDQSSR